MIYAYTGKTGSGKTYKMVQEAFRLWRNGSDIYSNTNLFFEKYKRKKWKTGRIVYFENINDILDAQNAVILFDEAQVLFNARLWEALPAEFQYKLQQHRKHKLTLLCTTQSLKAIDITYRRLIHFWFHCEDVIALLGKRNPSIISLHRIKEKDTDAIHENEVDETKVDDINKSLFVIAVWKRRLYDTLYDIGFRRFKTLWLQELKSPENENKSQSTSKLMILPKEMSLSEGQRLISLLSSRYRLRK